VRIVAPQMGWRLRVEAHRALAFTGDLRLTDPDGIVVDARFVAAGEHEAHLDTCSPWVREPLLEWLAERWERQRGFAYDVVGEDRASMRVTRR
jgi:hypothetical protein